MITIFILEGLITNYITIDLILFYFYFKKNKYPFIIGLLYDIIYTNTLFLHAFTFKIVSYLINKIKTNNYLYFTLIIVVYHVLIYLNLLFINHFNLYSLIVLIKNIIINIIIYALLYFLNKKYFKS